MRIHPNTSDFVLEYAKDKHRFLTFGADSRNPHPCGLVYSSYWKLFADGKEVQVYDTPVTRGGPQSFAIVPETAKELHAVYHGKIRSAEILPARAGAVPVIQENEICFSPSGAKNLLIEVNGSFREPLAVFVAGETPGVDADDENVLWFGKGIHRIRSLELQSHQTVYLEEGAILIPEQPDEEDEILVQQDWAGKTNYQDFLFARNQEDIRICGAGMIDVTALDWHARRTMVFTECSHIEISGVVMVGAAHWTMPFFGCQNVHVDGVRMLGYRENSDGIDLVDTHNAVVENCFIRTGDDAICLKSMGLTKQVETHDIIVRNCCVWNDKVRAFGVAGENRYDIYHAVFEKCDVIHSFADWTTEVGALGVYICDSGAVHHIVFRDIVIRHESNYAVLCCITKDKWSTDLKAGQVYEIVFENILFPKDFAVYLCGYDDTHRLEKIRFSRCRTVGKRSSISIGEYVNRSEYAEIMEVRRRQI